MSFGGGPELIHNTLWRVFGQLCKGSCTIALPSLPLADLFDVVLLGQRAPASRTAEEPLQPELHGLDAVPLDESPRRPRGLRSLDDRFRLLVGDERLEHKNEAVGPLADAADDGVDLARAVDRWPLQRSEREGPP